MKCIVLEGRHKLALRERPDPKPDGHSVIVKVSKCGICGGEFHFAYDTGDSPPYHGMVLGHEFAGTVVDPGCREDLKAGDRVVPAPNIGCGECETCRRGLTNLCTKFSTVWGGYAPYAAMPPQTIFPIPDDMTFTEAAILEPVATPVRAIRRLNIKNGDRVLVIGSGIIGCASAVLARHNGASYVAILEVNMDRAKAAMDRGDCHAVFDAKDPEIIAQLMSATEGKGFDKIVECSGAPSAMRTALNVLCQGGSLGLVGGADVEVPTPTILAVTKEHQLLGSYAFSRDDFLTGMELVRQKVLDAGKYATKMVALDEVPAVFEELRSGKVLDVKVIIDLGNS